MWNTKTWKMVYIPREMNGGIRGVALVEAETHQMAIYTFSQLYRGSILLWNLVLN